MLPCTVTSAGEASAALRRCAAFHHGRLAVHLVCTVNSALGTTTLLQLMRSLLMDDHNLGSPVWINWELPTHDSDLARAALIRRACRTAMRPEL